MFSKTVTIFRLLGIDVKVDASWIFLALLVVWTLADGLFAAALPDQPVVLHWFMGVGAALGLFASIIAHEFGHAVVARYYGIGIQDITLFVFGGVARMRSEPHRARDEFLMAIAGPAVSVALAFAFGVGLIAIGGEDAVNAMTGQPSEASAAAIVITYLALINGMLVVFNMLPAFPLDGGRVLRSFLWGIWNDLIRATRVAATIGNVFGLMFMFLGIMTFFGGGFISGVWYFLIGIFVRNASQMSYQQVLVKRSLGGRPISTLMTRNPIAVPPYIDLREFVEHYVYRFHHKLYPVVNDAGRLQGTVSTRELKEIPIEQWETKTVGDIAKPIGPANAVPSSAEAAEVLERMNAGGAARMLVVDANRAVGIIGLKDLIAYLTLKLDLEG